MGRKSREYPLVTCVLVALACGMARQAAAQVAVLPEGEAPWSLSAARRDATPTRERVSMNGLWRWQPAGDAADAVPDGGWGYLRVPTPWPGGGRRGRDSSFYPNPAWEAGQLRDVTAAWYQADVTVPDGWAGRRIALTAEFVNSFATVFVDGRKVDDIRFPAGEVDLSGVCRPGETHVVSMLVLALPLRAVMMSFSDTDAAREVRGQVARRGLCGDVSLVAAPRGARIGRVKVETSVRNWQITFRADLEGIDPETTYALRAVVTDGAEAVREFRSEASSGAAFRDGHLALTSDWRPDKLWDLHTPENQYDVTVSLVDGDSRVLDQALPERFGFRELWINGRDFYLNGSRVFLSFTRGQPGWDYEGTRETLARHKAVGINFVAVGGFGCEPGAHSSLNDVLRAADDAGTLVALTQPHMGQYDWDAPDADRTNGYAQHAEFYTHVAGNHPSVVFYATSHNGCGYAEDMNPDLIDGLVDRSPWTRGNNVAHALRAEAIVESLDDSRILYHHAAGNLGAMHTSNFYANFTPIQEMSDWFEHWATVGVKPLHLNEYGVPYPWDWSMYRGWYKDRREFGSAVVPWEFCMAEWDAQFYGSSAYRIGDEEAADLRWEAQRFREGALWHRWDLPYNLNYAFPQREGVYSMYVTDNWRAFRTWGLSVNDPSDYLRHARDAVVRNNMPLLAYIGGKPGAFTSKDHNFLPGETVEKQLIVINNSRETVTADCRWSLPLPGPVSGERTITLPTGQQERIPLALDLPADLTPGQYVLEAMVRFGTGEAQEDTFAVDVLPRPRPAATAGRIALLDPVGDTGAMLRELGVAFEPVVPDADVSGYDTFIVGKGALTVDGPAPDISRVRDGLKVIVFEQTGDVLEKRLGFRTARYGLRRVFRRVPDHPLLAGLSDEHLRNWRGDSTVLPGRIERDLAYPLVVEWCGIRLPQVWRCGNRGNVASALIEKPASGDFLPILDGGYALQYATLMEYREGRGLVLFCQTDVSGRTEGDPAADALARNILRYVAEWQPAPRRTVVYAGEEAGSRHLAQMGLSVAAYDGSAPSDNQVLVVGPGGAEKLSAGADAVREWVRAGGRVVALGLTGEEASAFLPMSARTTPAEHIAAYFDPLGAASPLAGVSPADVHNRDPRELPLVTGGVEAVGDGVLAEAEGANVVFCQLPPWQLDYSGGRMNIKRTFRKLSYCTSRLLANMGASGPTSLLEHFSRPVVVPVDRMAAFRGTLRIEQGDAAVALPERWLGLPLLDGRAPEGWAKPGFDDAGWRSIEVPGAWEQQFADLVDFDGTFLYRAKVTIPPALAQGEAVLILGAVDDEDLTYVNGTLVGSINRETNPNDYWSAVRSYRLPPGTLVPGENVIAIQVEDVHQAGGIMGFATVPDVPVLDAQPEQRWLDGLYLDVPEEWDYPYRFFRW